MVVPPFPSTIRPRGNGGTGSSVPRSPSNGRSGRGRAELGRPVPDAVAEHIEVSSRSRRTGADPLCRTASPGSASAGPDHGHGTAGMVDQAVADRAEPGTTVPRGGHHHEIGLRRGVRERLDRVPPDRTVDYLDLWIAGPFWCLVCVV